MDFENLIQSEKECDTTDIPLFEIDISGLISRLLKGGKVSAVASRPAMGKTTLLCQIAMNACLINNINCYYFCLCQGGDYIKRKIRNQLSNLCFATDTKLMFAQHGEICIDELSSIISNEISDGVVIIDGIEQIKSPSYRRTIAVLKHIAEEKNTAIILSGCLPRLFRFLGNKNTIADRVKYLSYFDDLLLIHREPFDFDNIENADDIEIFMPESELSTPAIMEYLCGRGYYKLIADNQTPV